MFKTIRKEIPIQPLHEIKCLLLFKFWNKGWIRTITKYYLNSYSYIKWSWNSYYICKIKDCSPPYFKCKWIWRFQITIIITCIHFGLQWIYPYTFNSSSDQEWVIHSISNTMHSLYYFETSKLLLGRSTSQSKQKMTLLNKRTKIPALLGCTCNLASWWPSQNTKDHIRPLRYVNTHSFSQKSPECNKRTPNSTRTFGDQEKISGFSKIVL